MTTIAQWEAFAENTLTGDEAARGQGRELAVQTAPVRLARRARHRKPGRRPMPPLWAGAILLALDARNEMEAAAKAQLARYARDGAR
jgi:hypothetical protein